eukprot:1443562-Rhodomonas_salina.2
MSLGSEKAVADSSFSLDVIAPERVRFASENAAKNSMGQESNVPVRERVLELVDGLVSELRE